MHITVQSHLGYRMNIFEKFERYGQKTYNGQDVLKNHFLQIYPIHYTDNCDDETVATQYADKADYVWIVNKNINVLRTFPWHFKPTEEQLNKKHVFPYVYKSSKRIKSWEYAKLIPTKVEYTGVIEHKNIAAIYDVYCGKDVFDVFYLGLETDELFTQIQERAPHARVVSSHKQAQDMSTTDMFWLVPNDIELGKFFKFSYRPDDWSHKFVHVFGNGNVGVFDGIALFPKAYNPTDKELQHRFYADKKTVSLIASTPKKYPVYNFETFEEYQLALEKESELFWYVPTDVQDVVDLDLYFDHHNQYDRRINHVFLNDNEYDGVVLFSKHSPITEKEFNHRFIANKKEHPEVYSRPKKFDQFVINNYADYKLAMERSTTEMFWGVPDDVEVSDDFDFDIYFTHHNTYDRNITHVFANGKTYDGIVLFSKNVEVIEREVDYRFYAEKKEWNIVASHPKIFPVYKIDTYDEYLEALKKTPNELFWMSSSNIQMLTDIYNVYISHHDRNLRKQNHVFLHQNNEGVSFNGMILCSVHTPLTQKEVEYRHPVNRIEHTNIVSKNKRYDHFNIETYEDYLHALETSETEMFWMDSPNIDTTDFNFKMTFDFENEYDRKENHAFVHMVDGKEYYNGLFLCSKHKPLTKKEVEYRHIANAKEWDIMASFAVFYERFIIETYDDYLRALDNSETEMFYGYSENIDCRDFAFDHYFTHDNEYDRKINHNFIHKVNGKEYRNGVFLFSKHSPVTQKEIEHRHIVNAKEWNIVASRPVWYDRIVINNYKDYNMALESSKTEMFWGIPSDVEVDINFEFDYYFTHDQVFERTTNHVFLNDKNYDGIILFSKHSPVTEKEIKSRFLVNKKEHNVIASYPKQFSKFVIETYNDYLNALETSKTEMFWATTNNIKIAQDFDFNFYFSHHNTYDRNINHVFAHEVNGKKHYNGLFLLSKNVPLTQKEIEFRTIANRKEWDIVASGPVEYDKFKIKNYQDYLEAFKKSKTEMFWMIPSEVVVDNSFNFNTYFTHDQIFERKTHHVFKNGDAWDGISLVSKHANVTEREINMRFLTNKKQYNIVASTPKLYDIVFISKDEEHADKNYKDLLIRFPRAKRVHGVEGIHNAHIAAAKLCNTDMIWIVDADAEIVDNFNFDYYVPAYDPDSKNAVHVWKSKNPINGLIYGYGAVKLLPRELTLNMDTTTTDMTTSIGKSFKVVNRISNVTKFNTDEFSAWRSAFRECVKLSSKAINGQLDEETEFRLKVWCTRGKDKPFGLAAINGAIQGKKYGESATSKDQLGKINDFNWLLNEFNKFKDSF